MLAGHASWCWRSALGAGVLRWVLACRTIEKKTQMLAGHASGCWHSALGAGKPYNREKNKSKMNFDINSLLSSDSSLTKVPSLQTTGSPQVKKLPHFWGRTKGGFEGIGEFFKGTSKVCTICRYCTSEVCTLCRYCTSV